MKIRIFLSFFLIVLNHSAYPADFFDSVEVVGGASPPPVYRAFYNININFDELQEGPDSLTFELPNGINTTVLVTEFFPRQGYQYYDEDEDPPGTPPFWIPVGTPHEEIGYKWAGSNDKYDVLITVHNGILYGFITGNEFRYGMSRIPSGSYRMYEFDYDFFPETDILEAPSNKLTNYNKQTDAEIPDLTSSISHVKSYDFSTHKMQKHTNTATVLDVLIVWTEEARTEAGGSINNPNDTADIDALMVAAIDHTNTAFSNSAMSTVVTKFHTAKYDNFVYAGNGQYFIDLRNLRQNTAIKNLRNQVGADTVIAFIGNDFNAFGACGAAYVQTYPGCTDLETVSCGVGVNFKEYSYAITTEFCSIWDDTFTHELGHNMGANHVDIAGTNPELTSQWIQAVRTNGFPDAFGHRTTGFKSIMSVFNTPSNPTSARRLYFSNPNIQADGINTGVLDTRNNARLIDQLTPVMSNYATRPDLIFMNGFE